MISLRCGTGTLPLPERFRDFPVIAGEDPPPLPDPAGALLGALRRPFGLPPLQSFVEPGDRVVVVVPDSTREAALPELLPALLGELRAAGPSSLVVRIANGTHRRATPAELSALERLAGVPVGDRSCDDPAAHEPLGKVEGLGVVRVDREVALADRVVLVGAASFHYLAGFGGGGKLLAPGTADRATALSIHRRCLAEPGPGRHPAARAGSLAGNPLQEAIARVARLAPPLFLVQVVLQRGRRPAALVAGALAEAHQRAAELHRAAHERHAGQAFELVVASAGGAPHDENLYQAHKALEAAARLTVPGGTVVLVAACPEGAGSQAFGEAAAYANAAEQESALRRSFSIAGQTALSLRRKAEGLRCLLVSDGIPEALARGLGLEKVESLEAAAALVPERVRGALLPDGALTLALADGGFLPA